MTRAEYQNSLRKVVSVLVIQVRLLADFEIALLTPLQCRRAHCFHYTEQVRSLVYVTMQTEKFPCL